MLKTGANPVDVQDFQFKLQCRFDIFQSKKDFAFSKTCNLVSSASRYGLFFVGTNSTNFQVVFIKEIEEHFSPSAHVKNYTRRVIDLPSTPQHLSVNCDHSILAVVVEKDNCSNVLFYNIPSLVKLSVTVLKEIRLSATPGVYVLEVNWNPSIPSIFTACKTDNTLGVYEFKDGSVNINELPSASNARSFCWSPKGKQLAVGSTDGKITQYKPDLKAVKIINAPALNGVFSLVSLQWISNYQFIGVFQPQNPQEQCCLIVIDAPKTGEPTFTNYYDICYSNGLARPVQFYPILEPHWNILMMASSNSMEVGVLGSGADVWTQWIMSDTARAELPLTSEHEETSPIGLALDTSSTEPLTWGESTLNPAPYLLLLSNYGVLCCFKIVNLKTGAANINSLPEVLGDLSGKSSFTDEQIMKVEPKVSIPVPVQPQPQIPAVKPVQPVATTVSQLSNLPFGGFTVPTSNTSLFGGQISITPVSKTSTQGGTPSGIFSQQLAASVQAKGSTTAETGSFLLSSLGSNPPSVGTQPGFSMLSDKTKSGVSPIVMVPVAPAQAPVTSQLISKPREVAVTSQPAALTQKAPTVTAVVPKAIQPPSEALPVPFKSSEDEDDLIYKKMIGEECSYLKNEIAVLLHEGRQLKFGLKSEDMEEMVNKLNSVDEFIDELVETCQVQNAEVHTLKQNTIQSWAWLEEAKSGLNEGNQDQTLTAILKARPLDSVSEKQLDTIRQMKFYLESQMAQTHAALDEQWDNFQEYSKKVNKIQIPTMETIFQTMVKQNGILQKQEYILKDIKSKLNQKKRQTPSLFNSFNGNVSLNLSDGEIQTGQPENLCDLYYQRTLNKVKALTPQKVETLRNILANKPLQRVKVKPQPVLPSVKLTPDRRKIFASSTPIQKSKTMPKSLDFSVSEPKLGPMDTKKTTQGILPSSSLSAFVSISAPPSQTLVGSPIGLQKSLKEDKQNFVATTKSLPSVETKTFSLGSLAAYTTSASGTAVGSVGASKSVASLPFGAVAQTSSGFSFNSPTASASVPNIVPKGSSVASTLGLFGSSNTFSFTSKTAPSAATTFGSSKVVPGLVTSVQSTNGKAVTSFDSKASTGTSPLVSSSKAFPLFSAGSNSQSLFGTPQVAPAVSKPTTSTGFMTSLTPVSKSVASLADSTTPKKATGKLVPLEAVSVAPSQSTAQFSIPQNLTVPKPQTAKSSTVVASASDIKVVRTSTQVSEPSSPNISASTGFPSFSLPSSDSKAAVGTTIATTTASRPVFGTYVAPNSKSEFGNSSSSVATQMPGTSSVAGSQKSIFGTAVSTAPSIFGNSAGTTAHGSIFGTTPLSAGQVSLFGTAPSTTVASTQASIFGTATSTSVALTQPSIFATSISTSTATQSLPTVSQGSIFGTSTGTLSTQGSLFGVPTITTSTQAPIFGTATSTSTIQGSIFGTPTATATQASLFGTTSTSSAPQSSIFGSPVPTTAAPQAIFSTPASTTPATQGSLFGTSSVPVSATQAPIFGTSNSTSSTAQGSIFGTQTAASTQPPIFGNSASVSSSSPFSVSKAPIFDASSQSSTFSTPATQSVVTSSTQSVFGAPVSSSSGQTFFGSTVSPPSTQSSIFAAAQPAQSSLFSATATGTSIFGTKTPPQPSAFGASVATSSGPVFGAASATSNLVFGSANIFGNDSSQPSPAGAFSGGGSLFGQSAFGTSAPVVPATTSQSIFGNQTAKSVQFGGASAFGSSAPFGSPVNPNSFGESSTFGGSTPGNIFGQAATSSTGFGGGNMFAQTSATSASVFAQPSTFGSQSMFGTTTTSTGGNVFNTPTSNSAFGGSLFGAPTASTASSVFGMVSPAQNTFGTQSNVFGTSSAPQGASFGFSGLNVSQNSGFEQMPSANPFMKTAEAKSPFASNSLFGTNANTSTTFGGGSVFGQQSTFGGNTFGASPGQPSSPGAFSAGGGSVAQSGFGSFQNPQQGGFAAAPVFGAGPAFGAAPSFGSAPSFGGTPAFGAAPSFGSPNKVFGGASPPTAAFGGSPSSQNSAFGNLANQNTIGFGNLAQQSQNPTGSAPFSGGTTSFSSWR